MTAFRIVSSALAGRRVLFNVGSGHVRPLRDVFDLATPVLPGEPGGAPDAVTGRDATHLARRLG